MTTTIPNTFASIDSTADATRARADFDALFRAHQPRLVDALALIAGDRELAADAVQEAFVSAHLRWRRIGRYDDPVGWIRRVAINRLRDEHRRGRRKRRAIDRLAARDGDGRADGIVDGLAMTGLDHDLARHLAELTRRQRICVVLRYVEDLGVAEIAQALDVSEGTVKSTLSDARSRLRTLLDAPSGPPIRNPGDSPARTMPDAAGHTHHDRDPTHRDPTDRDPTGHAQHDRDPTHRDPTSPESEGPR